MGTQVYNLIGEISVNFFLAYDKILDTLTAPLHPAVKKFVITPEVYVNGKQTGTFLINLTFEIDTEENDPRFVNVAANIGRDILNRYLGLLSFGSGYPIHILKPPLLIYNDGMIKKIRHIKW
ncbi:MAG TPA: hypothetical protein DCY12_06735 [Candidatus Atribacteria bacterium]|nr:hypothetical protein [Candidatus Atribacteria bacterium]